MEDNKINGFEIEDNIPLLSSRVEVYNKIADTLVKINVNQSFFVQLKDFDAKSDISIRQSIKNVLDKIAKVSFSMKKVKDDNKVLLGYRFWKLAEEEAEGEENQD